MTDTTERERKDPIEYCRPVSLQYLKKQELCHSQYQDDLFHQNLGGSSAGWCLEHTEVKETKII